MLGKNVVNDYGNIPPGSEAATRLDAVMRAISPELQSVLDQISLRELPVAINHLNLCLHNTLGSYRLERQVRASKAARAGTWQPGLGGPGTYQEAEFTIDDVNWFDGYLRDDRTWREIEDNKPFYSVQWNGHEKPMFNMGQAINLAGQLNKTGAIKSGSYLDNVAFMHYRSDEDTWYLKDPNEEVWDPHPGVECELAAGGTEIMYPVGSGYWIWDGRLKETRDG